MTWRRLKNDVMKPPFRPYLFAIFQGTGAQLVLSWIFLVFFYAVNLLSNLQLRPALWYYTIAGLGVYGWVNGAVVI
jgi:hypothetical protein